MKNRLLKKRKDFSKQFIFNLEIYLLICQMLALLLFNISSSFWMKAAFNSIQTNFLSLSKGLGLEY